MQGFITKHMSGFLRVLLTGFLVLGASVQAQGKLPPELAQAWAKTKIPEAALSLTVEEIGGPRLFAVNPDVPRNPASVMKLVTTYAALSHLGPNYAWRTDLLINADAQVSNGVLSSPLYVRASGDPLLLIQNFSHLLEALKLRGITQLSEVIVDRSIFGDVAIDPGSFDGAADRPYNASPDAFIIGFGALRLLFSPDEATRTWQPSIDPAIEGVGVEGAVEWKDGKCLSAPAVNVQTITVDGQVRFKVSGQAAGSCGEFDEYKLALSQQDYAARVFKSVWKELGGTMTGAVKQGSIPVDAKVVATNESEPLAEVIRLINKTSNNVMTRVLLLTLGAEAGRRPATVESSAEVVKNILAEQDIPMKGLILDNGSGLSRTGVVSSANLAQMLRKAWQSQFRQQYLSSLSVLGVDGTMRNRLKAQNTQARAHMKSGLLRDARSVAGYVMGNSGKRYILVSLTNHERANDVRGFEDTVIAWLIAH